MLLGEGGLKAYHFFIMKKASGSAGSSKKIARQSTFQIAKVDENQGVEGVKSRMDRALSHSFNNDMSFKVDPTNPKKLFAFKVRF